MSSPAAGIFPTDPSQVLSLLGNIFIVGICLIAIAVLLFAFVWELSHARALEGRYVADRNLPISVPRKPPARASLESWRGQS
ncbi:MAG TPA: hypothetical protein VE866_05560, partial [Candidatus Binatia bacterium]|nr:hypothetical protein [Candidatus Binatia bacterium]